MQLKVLKVETYWTFVLVAFTFSDAGEEGTYEGNIWSLCGHTANTSFHTHLETQQHRVSSGRGLYATTVVMFQTQQSVPAAQAKHLFYDFLCSIFNTVR